MKKEPLLQAREVHWQYEDTAAPSLANVNLDLYPGEVVGVVGPAGAGKTTLLLMLSGLVPANYAGHFVGERKTHAELGIVFQDPETQFIGLTVEEELAFSLENVGFTDAQIEQRIGEVLELVGLQGFAERSPFELSGGEKQRVAIASALSHAPHVLLLDEPTSELDPLGAREVFSLLQRLKQENEMTIMVSSHATEELAAFCDRMILVAEGKIVLDLPVRDFFARVDVLDANGIFVPEVVRLYYMLCETGSLREKPGVLPLDVEELALLYREAQLVGEGSL
ncbi:energy-coupling factor ABC transporter ATP-binding protein [Brevibacillus reuszeri]|uniref:Cobalt ABC transporter ATP-binding protein n=1 Tax=Brevibacillus reuszeri TaxID=54915 RepID=A0A0K9YSN5_9BACL|nr:ABC transporter ATP-binding protein [Brevibacillus reuszeri]KNB71739.1 cobalt ABC transporter ATP-binding protein [Brevibacillus reuszeri]MED1855436.1 ABC transporter ATP-binding protein [Brevibacillus reuszeri]GED67416.1 energy-coupling factor ABC transporter ATP-binding protein [Brevibacillus reuszeri]